MINLRERIGHFVVTRDLLSTEEPVNLIALFSETVVLTAQHSDADAVCPYEHIKYTALCWGFRELKKDEPIPMYRSRLKESVDGPLREWEEVDNERTV